MDNSPFAHQDHFCFNDYCRNFTPPMLLNENMHEAHYDYIITGSGCAGLSLAMHLLQHSELREKKILLIDEASKNQNDRTWCFWETEPGLFENIVYRQWDHLQFYSDAFSQQLFIAPFRYKMVRGLDYYGYCISELQKQPSVHFLQGRVEGLISGDETGVVIAGKKITAAYVFNSILFEQPKLEKNEVWLLQHFKGWTIETKDPVFDLAAATLMDFRVSQQHGTTFCYVLPFSPTKALVEYTLFTETLLQPEAYDEALKIYIGEQLQIRDYTIHETEFGVIPMTNHSFPQRTGNIVNIGTAGGQTKGSSGYTFYFIQQHSRRIAESLAKNGHPFVASIPKRFRFYDSVLLQVLSRNLVPGQNIFTTMFQKNNPKDVLAFLNNASSLTTELRIIATLPTAPFFKAALHHLL